MFHVEHSILLVIIKRLSDNQTQFLEDLIKRYKGAEADETIL